MIYMHLKRGENKTKQNKQPKREEKITPFSMGVY